MKPNRFKINDLVETIDDTITGRVISISADVITIKDAFGFEHNYNCSELIKIKSEKTIEKSLVSINLQRVIAQKKPENKKKKQTVKSKKNHSSKFEVDLHIQQLTASTRGMTNFEILTLQLETAKKKLDFAFKKRIPIVVFIHGVGEGKLKEELRHILRSYNNLNYYDADYRRYGYGATEVKLFLREKP